MVAGETVFFSSTRYGIRLRAMGKERQLSTFIERFYKAALDHSVWDTLLADLSDHLHSNIAALYSPYLATGGADTMGWTVGLDDAAIKAYVEYYGPISTNFQVLRTYPVGAVYTDQMAPDYGAYERSEAFTDFFEPLGAEHLSSLVPLRGERRQVALAFRRGARLGHYDDEDIAQLRHLAPHLSQAFRLGQRLDRVNGNRHSLAEALELSGDAILVLDGRGRLVFMNRRAQEIVAEGDGFRLDSKGAPRASVPSESTRMAAAIHGVTRGAKDGARSPGDALQLTRISLRRPYQVLVAPLARGETKLGRNGAAVLVIKDPEAEPDTSVHSLRQLYGLTATEAAFVAAFVEETSLKGTAERLSLTMSSARTYMKRIFLKAEVNSQAALMKLVLTGSAMPTLR